MRDVLDCPVVEGAVKNKAGKIIVVDVNDDKEAWARKFGATDFVNPTKLKGQTIQEKLIEMTDGGCDYTFDCTGNVAVMRAALEACHKGWGESIIIGVAAAGKEISTGRKFPLLINIQGIYHVTLSNWINSIPARYWPCLEGLRIRWYKRSFSAARFCRGLPQRRP